MAGLAPRPFSWLPHERTRSTSNPQQRFLARAGFSLYRPMLDDLWGRCLQGLWTHLSGSDQLDHVRRPAKGAGVVAPRAGRIGTTALAAANPRAATEPRAQHFKTNTTHSERRRCDGDPDTDILDGVLRSRPMRPENSSRPRWHRGRSACRMESPKRPAVWRVDAEHLAHRRFPESSGSISMIAGSACKSLTLCCRWARGTLSK